MIDYFQNASLLTWTGGKASFENAFVYGRVKTGTIFLMDAFSYKLTEVNLCGQVENWGTACDLRIPRMHHCCMSGRKKKTPVTYITYF